MRILQATEDTTLDRLGRALRPGRPRRGAPDASLDRLRAANPHADPERLAAGTLLVLPDGAGFEPSAGVPAPMPVPLDEMQALTAAAFQAAESELGARLAARDSSRKDLRAALEGDAFQRLAAGDDQLRRQGEEALANLAKEEDEDPRAAADLARVSKAAQDALSRLGAARA